jgi:GNAT superfamily N-acetyltransferase
MTISINGPVFGQSDLCNAILRSLPDWFGIESAIVQYVQDAETMPTFVASVGGEPAGLLCVNRHFPETAEVHLVAVRAEHHRQGLGRAMIHRVEAWLRADGVELLEVKTLSASSPDLNYARTRKFYKAVGFRPLEEIKTLWDEHNPCLILVKPLS